MRELEQVLLLFVCRGRDAGRRRTTRRRSYPVFLAIGGALLALVPATASFTLPPELALALFVTPVLLDAAYDTSVRDLKDNWRQVAGLVVVAVPRLDDGRGRRRHARADPGSGVAPALALGAVVAPPDAVAATSVLRPLRPPYRILTILGGERAC